MDIDTQQVGMTKEQVQEFAEAAFNRAKALTFFATDDKEKLFEQLEDLSREIDDRRFLSAMAYHAVMVAGERVQAGQAPGFSGLEAALLEDFQAKSDPLFLLKLIDYVKALEAATTGAAALA